MRSLHLPPESIPLVVVLANMPSLDLGIKADFVQLKNKVVHWLNVNIATGLRVETQIIMERRTHWVGSAKKAWAGDCGH